MSDFPMLIADSIESRGGFYDASPEIIKFIIAANMVQTSTDITFYKEAIGTARDEIDRLVYMHSAFEKEIGKGGILDMNIHGKPTSLFHLGLSNARASLETRMSKEALEKSLDLYRKTMRDVLDAWNLARPEHGKWDYSGISVEQRKFAAYLREHGPCTPKELFNAFKDQMSQLNFDRLWQEMRDFGGVYEKSQGFFDVA